MKKEISTKSLYQKYRPENFKNILGQDEAVLSLENSIKNRNISHAYLFSGGRGSGKTSTARIFAKEMDVKDVDLYEIDAASNRGIEQIRELRELVKTLPLESKYKFFIIDEVHMLTKEAFNALLKTLEEPPKHIIFVLATTEKYKILDTIISRCQNLDFKKASLEKLIELIKNVSKKENISIDQLSVEYIARLGDGSFRDTLSQLQKTISIFGDNIKISEIEKILSSSDRELEINFLKAISEKNEKKILEIYLNIIKKEINVEVFIEKILDKIRINLLIKNSEEFEEFYKEKKGKEEVEDLKKINNLNSGHLLKFLEILDLIKKADKKEIAFEVLILDLVK